MGEHETLWIGLALTGAILFLLLRWVVKAIKRHRRAVERIGRQYGLSFDLDAENIDSSADVFSWFKKGKRYHMECGLRGEARGYQFSYFELRIVDGNSSNHTSVFAVCSPQHNLPYFVLQPAHPRRFAPGSL